MVCINMINKHILYTSRLWNINKFVVYNCISLEDGNVLKPKPWHKYNSLLTFIIKFFYTNIINNTRCWLRLTEKNNSGLKMWCLKRCFNKILVKVFSHLNFVGCSITLYVGKDLTYLSLVCCNKQDYIDLYSTVC